MLFFSEPPVEGHSVHCFTINQNYFIVVTDLAGQWAPSLQNISIYSRQTIKITGKAGFLKEVHHLDLWIYICAILYSVLHSL